MKNVLVVGGGRGYEAMFARAKWDIDYDLSKVQLVCFTGGEDVTPSLYGDRAHPATHSNYVRDAKEEFVFKECIARDIPMAGICRGGQFLNVMSGGRLYQDVDGHCANHEITDVLTGETLLVSSTHHQMFMPSPEAILVATSGLGHSREWFDGSIHKKDMSDCDYEVLYYPKTNALCFQPHPEFISEKYAPMTDYFFKCLDRFLIDEKEVA